VREQCVVNVYGRYAGHVETGRKHEVLLDRK